MEARNMSVNDWIHGTVRGAMRQPSFLREESWDRKRVRKFLTTLIYKSRPVEVLLVLENKLIPADILMRRTKDNARPLGDMYKEFIHERAKLISAKMRVLCDGEK